MSRDGTVHRSEDAIALRYERRLAHPIEAVWQAITDPAELRSWLGRAEIDLEPGGGYVGYHGPDEEMRVEDRVLRVEPPTLFEHTFWQGAAPRSVVRWELTATDDGTLLVLTHTFGDEEVPDRARNAAGWHRIADMLAAHLDHRPDPGQSPELREELETRYRYLDTKVESRDDGNVLRYERRLDHPVQQVWAALTEPGELVAWLAEAQVELVEGGRLVLRWQNTDAEGNHSAMEATITELDPPRLIEYEGAPHGRLRWELSEDGDGCLLRLTVFTPEIPDEVLRSALAGWHVHLEHLAEALDGRAVDWPRWDEEHRPRWAELNERYSMLGAAR